MACAGVSPGEARRGQACQQSDDSAALRELHLEVMAATDHAMQLGKDFLDLGGSPNTVSP
jgi:hypothetical protein